MKDFLMTTYTIALPAVLGYIVWILQQQRKERIKDGIERDKRIELENKRREANSKGTMLLLRFQLIDYHDKYMKKGYIPSYAYENFIEMYEAYHKLGGNGMITHMKEEIENLRLNKKEDQYEN